AFARQLPPDCEGNIVNLIDMRVWKLTPHFATYTLSKSALWTMTRTLAMALAPRIRVNGIGPGPSLINERQTPAQFAAQVAATPLGRGAGPEEICAGLRYILSAPSLTGQMLALDGGQHLPSPRLEPGSLPEE
ncbi:MAG: SDR family oxidoreductase, partial [Alphaproteobacteria bacterium]|nr:SDR family oxidoreductase [Alphaproteobacteria bacterium]